MNISYECNNIRILLPERIFVENIQEVEDGFSAVDLPPGFDRIILDASDLSYISSIGLRAILSLIKKLEGRVVIENAGSVVYEIFEETGFVDMLSIRKKLDFVDVTGLELLGEGAVGTVYRLNEEQVLKVYHDGRSRETVEKELQSFREAFVYGIPTMIPFRIVETAQGFGFVFEFVISDLLANILEKSPEKLHGVAVDMANLMKELGRTELDTGKMMSVSLSIEEDFDGIECLVSQKDAELIRSFIRAVPERNTCVHGDLHAGNIMLQDGKLLLIDMDDFGYGHPVWDMAQLFAVYQELIHEEELFRKMFSLPGDMPYEAFVQKICHMPSALVQKLMQGIKEEYFQGLSEADRNKCILLSNIYCDIQALRYDYRTIRGKTVNDETMEAKKQVAEHYLADMKKTELSELTELFSAWNIR